MARKNTLRFNKIETAPLKQYEVLVRWNQDGYKALRVEACSFMAKEWNLETRSLPYAEFYDQEENTSCVINDWLMICEVKEEKPIDPTE